MKGKVRKHLLAHYGTYMIITNCMIALGAAAFAILGVLSAYVSVPVLVGNAVVFGVLLAIGKFGNEQLEDIPTVCKVEGGCE